MVNRVGSLVYGPILAIFLLAWGSRRATGRSAVAGGIAGVALNLILSVAAPGLSWLWWNPLGCLTALMVGHFLTTGPTVATSPESSVDPQARRLATLLVALFAGIFLLLLSVSLLGA
jgi:SSS family solute:Na+ symporter